VCTLQYSWYNDELDRDMEMVKMACSGTLSLVKLLELSPKTVDGRYLVSRTFIPVILSVSTCHPLF